MQAINGEKENFPTDIVSVFQIKSDCDEICTNPLYTIELVVPGPSPMSSRSELSLPAIINCLAFRLFDQGS